MARLDPDRYIALDFGDRRIGVAAGSAQSGLARPLEMIERAGDDDSRVARRLRELVKEEQAGTIIIGDPLNMDGSVGERAEKTRRFARFVRRAVRQARVELQDERLSSFTADECMERDGVRKSQRKAWRDAYAAAAILQEYLDRLKTLSPAEGEGSEEQKRAE